MKIARTVQSVLMLVLISAPSLFLHAQDDESPWMVEAGMALFGQRGNPYSIPEAGSSKLNDLRVGLRAGLGLRLVDDFFLGGEAGVDAMQRIHISLASPAPVVFFFDIPLNAVLTYARAGFRASAFAGILACARIGFDEGFSAAIQGNVGARVFLDSFYVEYSRALGFLGNAASFNRYGFGMLLMVG